MNLLYDGAGVDGVPPITTSVLTDSVTPGVTADAAGFLPPAKVIFLAKNEEAELTGVLAETSRSDGCPGDFGTVTADGLDSEEIGS